MSRVVAPPAADAHAYRFGEAELAIYGEYELQTLERVLRERRPEALTAVASAICRNTVMSDSRWLSRSIWVL